MESRSKPWRTLLRLGMLLGVVAVVGSDLPPSSPAPDDPAHHDKTESSAVESSDALRTGGLRAVIDPTTGEKVAEAAPPFSLRSRDAEALSQSTAGLTVVQRPDGSKHLYLGGRFMCGTVVRVGPDGVHRYCVNSSAQAEAVRRLPSTPAPGTAPRASSPVPLEEE